MCSVAQSCLTPCNPMDSALQAPQPGGAPALQAPLSMGFFRQEYWTGLPFSPPGHLPNSGIKPRFPELQANYRLSHPGSPILYIYIY